MIRFHDWHHRLSEYFAATRARAFAWGDQDCMLWAYGAVEAMTGVDLGADYRGKYSTEQGAARMLRRVGGAGVELAAAKLQSDAGLEEIGPLYAQRGDLVLVRSPRGPALAVVALAGDCAWCCGQEGIEAAPIADYLRAWRVG